MSEPINGTEIEQPVETAPWQASPVQVHRYKSSEAVADAAAKRFLDTANRAVEKLDHFVVALAGGSTPRLLYQRLTESPYRERAPWDKTFFVFGDERCVEPDDEASNYRMAKEALFDPMAGTGTIAVEAACMADARTLWVPPREPACAGLRPFRRIFAGKSC